MQIISVEGIQSLKVIEFLVLFPSKNLSQKIQLSPYYYFTAQMKLENFPNSTSEIMHLYFIYTFFLSDK